MKILISLFLLYNLCLFTALFVGRTTITNKGIHLESWERFILVLTVMTATYIIIIYLSIKKL